MAKNFLRINKGVTLRPQSTAPTSPDKGDLYYDSTTNTIKMYNGTSWNDVGSASPVTANRALVSNGSGLVAASSGTATELGYLSGVTSAIQTQIDSKQAASTAATISGSQTLSNKTIDANSNTILNISNTNIASSAAIAYSKLLLSNSIVNADISTTAAIVYSKLSLSNSITNSDIATSAAISYSKLSLSGSIINSDISSSAAIDYSKLAALTAGKALQSNATTGFIEPSAVTNTELGYLSGVTSSVQTQLSSMVLKSLYSAKGSILVATAASTPANLSVGTDGFVLTADSTQASGVKWAAATGGGSVTNVTASAPLSSSGGTTPNISISNITDTSISATAAIALSKLASLTAGKALQSNATTGVIEPSAVTNTELGYLSGVTSAIQTQLNGKEPSITAGTTAQYWRGDKTFQTLNATAVGLGNVTNTAQVPLSTVTTKGDLIAATASATVSRVGVGTDGQMLMADSTQTAGLSWISPSDVNYIPTLVSQGNSIGSFVSYTNTAGTSPVNGTGTTTTDFTISSAANTALTGTNLLQVTKAVSANTQGKGLSLAFSIDSGKKGKTLSLEFEYIIASGTFVAGNPNDRTSAGDSDLTVWVYDVTNSVLIQPSNYRLYSNSTTLADKFSATFQASSNSTSYRLILHSGTTNAAAFVMYMDQLKVRDVVAPQGISGYDRITYPTTPSIVGFGTPTAVTAYHSKSGMFLDIDVTFTSGTSTAVEARIPLPPGLTTSSTLPTLSVCGNYAGTNTGAFDHPVLVEPNVTYVTLGQGNTGVAGLAKATGSTVAASGQTVSIKARIPIQGWSANVQLSSDAGNSLVDFIGYINSSITLTGGTTNFTLTARKDSTGSWNGTQFTVPSPGDYYVSCSAGPSTASNIQILVYINGANPRVIGQAAGGAYGVGSTLLENLKSGDIISFRSLTTLSFVADTQSSFCISKMSNPQTIAATDTIAASYYVSATFSTTTTVPVNFDSKLYDTHSMVVPSATAWKATAPAPGKYSIKISGSVTTTGAGTFILYKNGALYEYLFTVSSGGYTSGVTEILLNAGDTFEVRGDATISLAGSTTPAYKNIISIARIGG